jgi:sugar phosphate isomerase/epimerase
MTKMINRRQFARTASIAGIASIAMPSLAGIVKETPQVSSPSKMKLSLNAYSFDKPLRAGTMTIDDMLEFCKKTGFDGVDITGYYFPGYPVVPSDDYIFHIKQKAFLLGIELGCTGVRNDFTWSDPKKREEEKKLVKDWIVVAQKLGAPGVRIFAGTLSKEKFEWEERAKWIAADVNECAEFGKNHGVMLALQNHNDFLKTADDIDKMWKMVNTDWVGLMLDIGSYHTSDPYADIARTAKYAITWQMKEKVFVNETQVETDFTKIVSIVKDCGYKGYLPLETLGEGDPRQKVEALYKKVKACL